MIEKIKELTKNQMDELVNIRSHLHQYPELSSNEYETQKFIIEELKKLGINEIEKIADTGVVATLRGRKGNSNRTIGLRADIDALPIQETNNVPYASKNKGVMHACGHDVHTSVQLGVAKNMVKMLDEIDGNVKLFFQPAEETVGGAKRMIEAGCLENPHVDAVFGLHVDGEIPVGTVWYRKGPIYAFADVLTIEVRGQSTHAALPELGVDAIVVAAAIIEQLQTIVSRKIGAHDLTILSFGAIHGGEAHNIICDKVTIEGTLRTLDEKIRTQVIDHINNIIKHVALAHGATAEMKITSGYPALFNDDEMVDFVKEVAIEAIGEEQVLERPKPSLGGEDFAYFAMARPSCFYNLGISKPDEGLKFKVHTPTFDVDINALYYGTFLQTLIAYRFFNRK